MSEHPNAALHRRFLENPEFAEELIAEDAVFRYFALGPLSGEYRGRDAVLGLFQEVGSRPSGPPKRQNEAFFGADDLSVCLARFEGQLDDRDAEIRMAEVFRWRNGQIVERWAYFDAGTDLAITV